MQAHFPLADLGAENDFVRGEPCESSLVFVLGAPNRLEISRLRHLAATPEDPLSQHPGLCHGKLH